MSHRWSMTSLCDSALSSGSVSAESREPTERALTAASSMQSVSLCASSLALYLCMHAVCVCVCAVHVTVVVFSTAHAQHCAQLHVLIRTGLETTAAAAAMAHVQGGPGGAPDTSDVFGASRFHSFMCKKLEQNSLKIPSSSFFRFHFMKVS